MRLAPAMVGQARGDEEDLVEVEGLAQLGREPQVPEMDRIERAAEEADGAQLRTCPSPSTMYFTLVSPSSPTGPRA